jgi:hypothetical protein
MYIKNKNPDKTLKVALKIAVFWDVAPCSLEKFTDVSEVINASIMRAISTRTSEKSVNFYQTTRRNTPEDGHLYTRCRENLKTHIMLDC